MIYDFILFEHLYTVQNHYKDLTNLAILLQRAGYKVAIADAFKEADLSRPEGIPHVNLGIRCPKVFKDVQTFQSKRSDLKKLYYRVIKDYYMYRLIKKLNRIGRNIYAGSLTLDTPVFFVNAFRRDRTYYMWALRSSHILRWKNGIHDFSDFVSKKLYCIVRKQLNLRLIVSNVLIKEEFIDKAEIDLHRLILRPERFILDIKMPTDIVRDNKRTLHLLFIGTLRPFKNVEFCMKALERLGHPDIYYTIAGRCKKNSDEKYNQMINNMAGRLKNVKRIDRYIPDDEYDNLIHECDFLILCDKTQASCASNGTMSEALLAGKPIIAPDFNPFKYEVENYNVGYLYKYDDLNSLCEVMKKALLNGADPFRDSLLNYQGMFQLEQVAASLKEQLSN